MINAQSFCLKKKFIFLDVRIYANLDLKAMKSDEKKGNG